MVRASSAEPAKAGKRKGTRSVSTLTPSQLARKRANDREAQRAIRARTKEHIDRLEQEVEELKSQHGRDKIVRDLMQRNKMLENELRSLKESMGLPMNTSPYSTPVYDDNLSTGSGAMPSPRTSPFPTAADYSSLPDLSQTFVPLPSNCEAWASAVRSNVSSPCPSTANTDDFGGAAAYIPTSVPTNMIPTSSAAGSNNGNGASNVKDVKLESYEDVDGSDAAFHLGGAPMNNSQNMAFMGQHHHHPHAAASPIPQQPWAMAYSPVYYPQVQSPVH